MKDITIVAIDYVWHNLTKHAICHSLKHIDPKEILIFSDREIFKGARHVICDPVTDMADIAALMLKGVGEHIRTNHALYVQWDGIANDATQWTDEFLQYDYIGAPWPWRGTGYDVGNGGFSLRSKKLLTACMDNEVKLSLDEPYAEDNVIGIDCRDLLESKYSIKYPSTELASQFSVECGDPSFPSFGFHGIWNVITLADIDTVRLYVTTLDYSNWNVHKWHNTLLALTNRNLYELIPVVMDQFELHHPELIGSVITMLRNEHSFWRSLG